MKFKKDLDDGLTSSGDGWDNGERFARLVFPEQKEKSEQGNR